MAEATNTTPEDRPCAAIYDLAGERLARQPPPPEGAMIGREAVRQAWRDGRETAQAAIRALEGQPAEFLMLLALYEALRRGEGGRKGRDAVSEAERLIGVLSAAMPGSAEARRAMGALAFMDMRGMPQ